MLKNLSAIKQKSNLENQKQIRERERERDQKRSDAEKRPWREGCKSVGEEGEAALRLHLLLPSHRSFSSASFRIQWADAKLVSPKIWLSFYLYFSVTTKWKKKKKNNILIWCFSLWNLNDKISSQKEIKAGCCLITFSVIFFFSIFGGFAYLLFVFCFFFLKQ